MNDSLLLIQHLHNTVLTKIGEHREVLVAYSGGIDSSVLLHALVCIQQQHLADLKIRAIYIHHGISQHADHWAKHCQQQCDDWQIPCIIEHVTLALDAGNIEQQARDARYQAIAKHLQANTALCTAQHLDDQCETFFLALKRGSGPTGLSAMPEVMLLNNHYRLRPLLTISRQQIEHYANAYHLRWVEDESNQDDYYDRNFLRLNVLPTINQRWPHFNQMVARSADLCHEQQDLLDELLQPTFIVLVDQQKSLLLEPLYIISAAKRNALLRMWFKVHNAIMPSRKQLASIWQTVIMAKDDSNPQFILHDHQIRRYQNRLYLLPKYYDLLSIVLNWNLEQPLLLPDGLGLLTVTESNMDCRLPIADEQVSVRFYAKGSYHIVGRKGSRQIKKLWQEFGIAPWMRSRIPLVFYNEQLITAVGVFVTEQGQGEEIKFQLNKT